MLCDCYMDPRAELSGGVVEGYPSTPLIGMTKALAVRNPCSRVTQPHAASDRQHSQPMAGYSETVKRQPNPGSRRSLPLPGIESRQDNTRCHSLAARDPPSSTTASVSN
jgi:hypothetical protein